MEDEPLIGSDSEDIFSGQTSDHDNRHRGRPDPETEEPQWYETRTPEEATALFRNELKRKPSIFETSEDSFQRLFRSWLEFYVVNLLSGPTLIPVQALVALLRKVERQGQELGRILPLQSLSSAAVALHRCLICMAEFPGVSLRDIEECRSALDQIYARSGTKPVASSVTRLALFPRLGLVDTGEADFQLAYDTYMESKADAASGEASEDPSLKDGQGAEDDGSEKTGPACGDAWLGFFVEWLVLNRRSREAVKLIERESESGGDLCSLCGIGPQIGLSLGLLPAIALGRQDLAVHWLRRLEVITPVNPRWLFSVGHRAHALARLGRIGEAREMVESAAPFTENRNLSAWNRLWFHHHAASVLDLANPETEAAKFHRSEAMALAKAFDARNGNKQIEARLNRPVRVTG